MLPNYYRETAIFTYEEDGVHVVVPDLPGCVTFGKDEEKAARMAREVLALHLYGMEEDDEEIPRPSSLRALAEQERLENNEVFMLVEAFMPSFREKQRTRSSRKRCRFRTG